MPDPSGLLRPSSPLRGFQGLGFGGSGRTSIEAFLPGERQIRRSVQEQNEEKPWWVKLLEIPDRLFGGQMIKGFLAGTGEPGSADNIVEGIRKNPAFQLLDILNPFGDPLTGKNTSFSDVRTAMDLNFGQPNVNEGWKNFVINLAGEILLDPSSFLLPFGAVAKGLKPGAGLVKAVETGQRAMLVFGVPLVNKRFVVPSFKSLDLKVAHGLEKWADFLNTNPVTKPLIQAFSRTGVGIKDAGTRAFVLGVGDVAAEQAKLKTLPLLERLEKIGHESPDMLRDGSFQEAISLIREYGIDTIDEMADAKDIIMGQGREVAQARHRYKRLIKEDQGFQDLVNRAENGDVVAADVLQMDYPNVQLPQHILDLHSIAKRPGVEFRRPTPQLTVERNIQGVVAPGTEGTVARGMAETGGPVLYHGSTESFSAFDPSKMRGGAFGSGAYFSSSPDTARLYTAGTKIGGKPGSVTRWTIRPGAQIFNVPSATDDELANFIGAGLRARGKSGDIESMVRDARAYGFFSSTDAKKTARAASDALGYAGVADVSPYSPVDDALDYIVYNASDIVPHTPVAGLSAKVIAEGEQRAVDLLARLSKNSPDLAQSIVDTSKELGAILDDVGMADVVSGFINGMNELYLPRSIVPEVRSQITAMFLGSVQKHFRPGARQFAESFMKRRGPLDQLDTLTANYLIRELGTKFTGNKPLKEFSIGEAEGILATAARIFEPIMPGIRKADPEAAKFFDTNPFLQTQKRLEQSTKLHEKALLNAGLLGPDSPLVHSRDSVMTAEAKLATNAGPINPDTMKPYKLLLVNPKGNLLDQARFGGPVDMGSALNHTIKDDNIGRKMIGRRILKDQMDEALLKGELQFDDAIDQLDSAAKLTEADDLAATTTDIGRVRNYKRLLGQRRMLAKGTGDPDQLLWYDERLDELVAEMKEEAAELRLARRDYLSGVKAETKEKTAMLRDILSRRLSPEETREMLRLREMEKGRGILPLDELRTAEPEAYQRMVDRYKDSEAVWVDADVYEGLWGKNGYLEKLRRPDMIADKFGIKWLDGMQRWFKAWTLMPPIFIQTWFRDFLSGHILQFMGGGLSPRAMFSSQIDSMRLSRAMRAGMRGDREALKNVNITRSLADGSLDVPLNGEVLYEKLAAKGVGVSSWWRDEMLLAGEEAAQGAGAAKGAFAKVFQGTLPPLLGSKWRAGVAGNPFHNPIIRKGVAWRSFLDTQVQVNGILARWKSGQTLDDAIADTMALSYDPRKGLTSFERSVMRRVIPFYGWTRFALGKMTDLYLTKPGVVTFWEKLHDSASKASLKSPDEFDAIMPEFLKDNFGVPWRPTKNGPEFLLLGNYVPMGEVVKLTSAIEDSFTPGAKGNLGQYVLERMDPFVKQAVEQAFNYSFFSQRELEQFPGEHTEMFGITMHKRTANVIRSIRFFNELDRMNVVSFEDLKGFTLAAGDAVPRGEKLGSAKQLSPLMRLATGAFGVLPRGYLVDVKEETRQNEARVEHQLARAKGTLRKRVEDQGKPAKEADIIEIQKVIADLMAEQRRMEQVQRQYTPMLRK